MRHLLQVSSLHFDVTFEHWKLGLGKEGLVHGGNVDHSTKAVSGVERIDGLEGETKEILRPTRMMNGDIFGFSLPG